MGFIGINTGFLPTPNAHLYISTKNPNGAQVTIDFPNREGIPGFPQTLSIPMGRSQVVAFPVDLNGNDIRVNTPADSLNGISVRSDEKVSIIGVNGETASTLVLPCKSFRAADGSSNLLEYKYFVFPTTFILFQSRILIVPCEATDGILLDGFLVRPLQPYETLLIEQMQYLTGTVVSSRVPLAVFVGHQCGQVPFDVPSCMEQVPAHAVYGTKFFVVPFALRESGDLLRIGSVTDNNEVTVTCSRNTAGGFLRTTSSSGTINSGQYHEYRTLARYDNIGLTSAAYRRDFCCIETSKPAIVMQYMLEDIAGIPGKIGDSKTLVPPINQYRNDYIVNTFNDIMAFFSFAVAAEFFNPDIASDNLNLMLNGVSYSPPTRANLGSGGYVPIRCSDGEVHGYGGFGQLPGDSNISYESPREPNAAMYASIYGFGREHSYAYSAGYQCEPIGRKW